jgi:hypothetical protein
MDGMHATVVPDDNAGAGNTRDGAQQQHCLPASSATPLIRVCGDMCMSPLVQALCAVGVQELAKRALVIAAAGAHNLLMLGPPGSGKTEYMARHRTLDPAALHWMNIPLRRANSPCRSTGSSFSRTA